MKNSFFLALIILCGCSTIKKSRITLATNLQRIDSSQLEQQYLKEITTIRKSTEPYTIASDSISLTGKFSPVDTTPFQQVLTNSNMTLFTTVTPIFNDGKIEKYLVNSKANTIPKIINIPIDTITKTKETGLLKENTSSVIHETSSVTQTSKIVSHLSIGGITLFIIIILAILLFVKYKFFK